MDLEKQIVLRTSRLIRVRNVRCLRSIVACCACRGCGLQTRDSAVGTPIVCIIPRDAKGLQQRSSTSKDLVRAPPKDVGQDFPGAVIDGMPQPARLFLLPHIAPHFVHFGFVHALQDDLDLARGQALQ